MAEEDNTPCHGSRKNQQYLLENMADFWPKDFWHRPSISKKQQKKMSSGIKSHDLGGQLTPPP